MEVWTVRKAKTANAIIATMNARTCLTKDEVEAIASSKGDTVRWYYTCDVTPPPDTPLAFPVAEEDLLDFKRKLGGRGLNEDQLALIAAWVPFLNHAYACGMPDRLMANLDDCIAKYQEGSSVAIFLEEAKRWMKSAAAR